MPDFFDMCHTSVMQMSDTNTLDTTTRLLLEVFVFYRFKLLTRDTAPINC